MNTNYQVKLPMYALDFAVFVHRMLSNGKSISVWESMPNEFFFQGAMRCSSRQFPNVALLDQSDLPTGQIHDNTTPSLMSTLAFQDKELL